MSVPLSLPIARSVQPVAEREASSREGSLAETSVPELLARAYRVSFSGSSILEPADAAPATVRFVGGAVVDASGVATTTELEWEVLGRLLPSETLDFATQHAQQYGVTPFGAVERLVLLPPESLVSARQALTALEVQALCAMSGDVRYAFVAPTEGDAPVLPGTSVEPLGLLASCFLVELAARTGSAKRRAVRVRGAPRGGRTRAETFADTERSRACGARSARSLGGRRAITARAKPRAECRARRRGVRALDHSRNHRSK